jgi:WD40 repeat protein
MRTAVVVLLLGAAPLYGQLRVLPPNYRNEQPPPLPKAPSLTCAAVSPDGTLVVTGYCYGGLGEPVLLRLWDAATGKEVRSIAGKGAVQTVAFTPDGKRVLTGFGGNDAFRLWDVETGKEVRAFAEDDYREVSGGLSADGKLLLTAGGKHIGRAYEPGEKWVCQWKLWDVETGKVTKTFDGKQSALSIGFSPSRNLALLHCQPDTVDDSILKVFDVETGKEIRSFSQAKEPCSGVAVFSPDGKFLLMDKPDPSRGAMSGAKPGPVLWDLEKDKEAQRLPDRGAGSPNPPNPDSAHAMLMTFSPGGKSVLTADADGMLRLWDLEAGKLAWAVEGDCLAAAFVAGGKEVLLVRVTQVRGWEGPLFFQYRDAATGEELRVR